MGDYIDELRVKLSALNTLEGEEYLKALTHVESEVTLEAEKLPTYTRKQVEELLRTYREKAKKSKQVKSFSFKKKDDAVKAADLKPDHQNQGLKSVESSKTTTEDSPPPLIVNDPKFTGRDLTYKGLRNAVISIKVPLSALTLIDLQDCTIYALSVVRSSAVVRECSECEIHICAKQIRVHDAHNCSMYIFSLTGPILEKCKSMSIGPFDLERAASSSDEDKEFQTPQVNKYDKVKDFSWLKSSPSPNWTLVGPKDWSRALPIPESN